MLVVISDLHLTDGTSGATISPGAFEIFAEQLQDLAESASKRVDGSYRPLERIDVLLLGDVLDVIRSTRWLTRSDVRPWTDSNKPEFVEMVTQITANTLRQNEESLGILRRLGTENVIQLPPADGLGRPALDTKPQPVPVKIHYMVGNHDWFYRLPGAGYDLIRQTLVRHMGLANRPERPFPHDPHESEELLEVMRRHKMLARHGDIYDPFNFEGDRNTSSLGDAIVIELLNRFPVAVEQEMGSDLPDATFAGLREIDNVRPLLLVPVWIDGLLERTCAFPELRKRVKVIWDRLAEEFLCQPFVRSRDTWNPNDLVDGLQRVLKFSKRLSIGWAADLLQFINGVRGGVGESYSTHALAEQDFRNRRARHIVYGHTHHTECVPLDASYAEGYVLNQTYFNSGTWRRTHRQTILAPQEHEFMPADVMTYLAFFQGDERRGRPYETWTGTLGLSPADNLIRRIDPAVRNAALRTEPVSPSAIRGRGPHFSPAGAPTSAAPTRRR
jgi:UDP-2,3-diacylglucosamine pyrophosphatase LpxH